MTRVHSVANRGRGQAGIQLVLGLCVMLGLVVGPAAAQVPTDTAATAGQELTDAVILDIFITSNEGEVLTSEVIAGEEGMMPEEEPTPEEDPMGPPDTTEAGQDTMYGEPQQQEEQQPQAGAAMQQDESVQEFARRMIDEHGRLSEQATQLSGDLGIEPEPNLVSTVLQNTVEGVTEELRATRSDSLDQEYMATQVVLHQQALGMLEHTLIPNAEDESLRSLLEEARGIVGQHLDQARDIFTQLAQEQYRPAE